MTYYLVRFLSRVVCLLPGRFCDRLGRAMALALWPFLPARRKKLATSQVAMCLGTDERESARIAKESAVRFGPMLFEVLRFPVIVRNMADYVEIEGREHLEGVLAQGKGAVIATGHAGNWELMGGALSQAGFPLIGVAMRQKDAAMDRFINEYRRLVGMHIIYKNDVREMFRMMKEGWVVGLLADQDTSRHDGIVLDFFGKPTNCVPGPAAMARSAGIGVIPGFITRKADGTHKIILYAPVEVPRTKDKRADIRTAEQAINRVLERHIREHPEEWFWLHDRWKSMREEF